MIPMTPISPITPARPAVLPAGLRVGTRLVIGIQNPKPINNLPPDLIRLKLRFRKFAAKAFVFTPGMVEEWLLRDNGDTWSLAIRQGRNQRVPRT